MTIVCQSDFSLNCIFEKKYSLLRKYKESGFDINKFFDESKDETKERQKVDKVSIDDIVNYYDKLQCNIKNDFLFNNDI